MAGKAEIHVHSLRAPAATRVANQAGKACAYGLLDASDSNAPEGVLGGRAGMRSVGFHAYVLATLLVPVAGCAAPGHGPNADVPSSPTWTPGQWWIYEGSDGVHYTHRVQGVDDRWGNATYRVRVELDRPDESGASSWIEWYDKATLGFVAQREGAIDIDTSCPLVQTFPLTSAGEMSCHVRLSRGGHTLNEFWDNSSKHPVGWQEISLPQGRDRTYLIQIQSRDSDESGVESARVWFSPRAENYARIEGGLNRTLLSWGRSGSAGGPGA
jgi:hypothetical protein